MEAILISFRVPLLIVTFVYIAVLLFIALDLWAGIRKAKARGEYRSSYGLRKTVTKIAGYYNMLLVITVIDALQIVTITVLQVNLPAFPFFTLAGALFAGFIELKSVYEKNDAKQKAKVQEAAVLLSQIIEKSKDSDALNNILEILKREQHGTEN